MQCRVLSVGQAEISKEETKVHQPYMSLHNCRNMLNISFTAGNEQMSDVVIFFREFQNSKNMINQE
jgi:hypothetical protein